MKVLNTVRAQIDATSMYRTVLYALMALTMFSWVFAVVGLIDFFVIAMMMQLVIAITVGYTVDRLLAYVFNVRPNSESIFITAFIMYFLILPNGTTNSFVVTALAMGIAAASKYVVTWRKKHIFNPAAFGVAAVGLLGLGYASWWVATPSLLLFLLIAGSIVVYKTRRLDMVATYISVSVAMIMLLALIDGRASVELFTSIFTSYPVLFFAFFMLTEPQTLAPKSSQRNGIAGGIAVLAHSQFALGPIAATPELALLVGNAVSAGLSKARSTFLTLTSRRKLPGDQVEYIFTTKSPLKYEAGQYAELHVPHAHADARGQRRMFTLASAPGTNEVSVITRHPEPGSTFKKSLQKLDVGKQIKITGIWGDFTLPKNKTEKILFVAGGVGITPFLSQLTWLKNSNQARDIVLIYGVRNKSDAIDLSEYNSQLTHCAIHEGVLTAENIKTYVPDIAKRSVYVSGPPVMVDSVAQHAKTLKARAVHRDFFAGY